MIAIRLVSSLLIFTFTRILGHPVGSDPSVDQTITILHTNDIHAHFDQFNDFGSDCSEADIESNKCYGGISRIASVVKDIRSKVPNTLFFDAGDQFQGTLFFNVFKASIIADWMNSIQYDLMTIGNHEFDEGEEYLGKFIQNLTFPVVSSNMNIDDAPHLKQAGVKPYTIFPQYKLGVIGVITNTTGTLSAGSKNIRFYNPVDVVQRHINELNEQGIYRIVCVSHNGYEHDKYLGENTSGISLIVGGHSHSLLLEDESLPGVVGSYPSPVTNLAGETTYVVQAHRWGDYVGRVNMEFDKNDKLTFLQGRPILLDQSIPKDSGLQNIVDKLHREFQEQTSIPIGAVGKPFRLEDCSRGECYIYNIATDASLEAAQAIDPSVSIGLVNDGGIRAGFAEGPVTTADVINVFPFGNDLVTFEITGARIWEMIEKSIAGKLRSGLPMVGRPRFSGLQYGYNPELPEFEKVAFVKVEVGGIWEDLDIERSYKVVAPDFVATGGGLILSEPQLEDSEWQPIIKMDDALIQYLKKRDIVKGAIEGRIQIVKN